MLRGTGILGFVVCGFPPSSPSLLGRNEAPARGGRGGAGEGQGRAGEGERRGREGGGKSSVSRSSSSSSSRSSSLHHISIPASTPATHLGGAAVSSLYKPIDYNYLKPFKYKI